MCTCTFRFILQTESKRICFIRFYYFQRAVSSASHQFRIGDQLLYDRVDVYFGGVASVPQSEATGRIPERVVLVVTIVLKVRSEPSGRKRVAGRERSSSEVRNSATRRALAALVFARFSCAQCGFVCGGGRVRVVVRAPVRGARPAEPPPQTSTTSPLRFVVFVAAMEVSAEIKDQIRRTQRDLKNTLSLHQVSFRFCFVV